MISLTVSGWCGSMAWEATRATNTIRADFQAHTAAQIATDTALRDTLTDIKLELKELRLEIKEVSRKLGGD